MGNILHSSSLKEKKMILKKAFDALSTGGALIVVENIIDPDRKENTFGLAMSLHMQLVTNEGFDYSEMDFQGWIQEIGFKKAEIIKLIGPSRAAIAYKW